MRRSKFPAVFKCVAVLFLGLTLTLAAQEGPKPRPTTDPQGQPVSPAGTTSDNLPQFVINARVNLVQLPLSVVDKNGRLIGNLEKEHFQVFEDNVLQEMSEFSHEDVPLSIGLVIDNSASMKRKRERVNTAALSFVRESNRSDETFIINFDDFAYLEQDFTTNIGELRDALDNIDTKGETAMYDAVYLAIDHMSKAKNDRRALLVISDGEDHVSKYGFNKVIEHAKAAKNVAIYAIGILDDEDGCGGLFKKSPCKKAKDDLLGLAEATGGQAYFPKSVNDVEAMCAMIAQELRAQYSIRYTPKNTTSDGKWRTVRVTVKPPKGVSSKLEVRAKPGYYAPTEAAEGK